MTNPEPSALEEGERQDEMGNPVRRPAGKGSNAAQSSSKSDGSEAVDETDDGPESAPGDTGEGPINH